MVSELDWSRMQASFREDTDEHLAAFEQSLLTLQKHPTDRDAIDAAFRAVHTIKGSAAIFELAELIRFAHGLESLFDLVRDGRLMLDEEKISILLKGGDHLAALVAHSTSSESLPEAVPRELVAISNTLLVRYRILAETPTAEQPNVGPVFLISPKPGLFKLEIELEAALKYLRNHAPVDRIEFLLTDVPPLMLFDALVPTFHVAVVFTPEASAESARNALEEALEFLLDEIILEIRPEKKSALMPSGPEISPRKEQKISSRSVRVDAEKLDHFVNLVGELVMKNGQLLQLARERHSREFMRPITEMSRLVENARELAMNLRMVPVGTAFRKLERLVSEAAEACGKQVDFSLTGEETELDKGIIEKLSDPLIHSLRNAVDHGIETAGQRIAAGKSPKGSIGIAAYHEAGSVIIEIKDDGAGLNYEKILAKAKARNLADSTRKYSLAEIAEFIFLPGFSTAETVSQISGRGVGMDVVKKNIESLRGQVRINSDPGKGTTLTITLPLTLAIIEGFLVRSGAQKFVIALEAVKECLDFSLKGAPPSEFSDHIFNLRGEALPFVRLKDLFRFPSEKFERESLVVVEQAGRRFGLVIDEPMGEHQTVVKPLIGFLRNLPGIGGATILGLREMALILDLSGIFNLIQKKKNNKEIALVRGIHE